MAAGVPHVTKLGCPSALPLQSLSSPSHTSGLGTPGVHVCGTPPTQLSTVRVHAPTPHVVVPSPSSTLPLPGIIVSAVPKYAKVSVEGVVDADGNPAAITVTGITQDEPLAGKGYGQTCPDGAGVGTDTALVRPERATSHHSSRDGRVYHISFGADDGHGGQCTGTVAVCVPLKKADKKGHKGGTCVDEGPLFDSTGPCK